MMCMCVCVHTNNVTCILRGNYHRIHEIFCLAYKIRIQAESKKKTLIDFFCLRSIAILENILNRVKNQKILTFKVDYLFSHLNVDGIDLNAAFSYLYIHIQAAEKFTNEDICDGIAVSLINAFNFKHGFYNEKKNIYIFRINIYNLKKIIVSSKNLELVKIISKNKNNFLKFFFFASSYFFCKSVMILRLFCSYVNNKFQTQFLFFFFVGMLRSRKLD